MSLSQPTRLEGGRRLRTGTGKTSPLVSIITVVYNAKEELSRLLQAVFTLEPEDFELIVIDGGSQDGTVELLRSFDERIDVWISEPDRGIYDAMNKAQTLAQGVFLYHLNAGDTLLEIPRRELEQAARQPVDAVTFRVRVDDDREFRPSFGFKLRLKNTLHHQGTFYRRETFGPYDLQFRILADFDANQRLALRRAKVQIVDKLIAHHVSGGAGDSLGDNGEGSAVVRKNFGPAYMTVSQIVNEFKGIRLRRQAALKRWFKKLKRESTS
jgi:glycosyltransferase involved in cell wall biosynthesis